MSLAPNTLFHFTKSYELLCQILSEGFKPSYAKESMRLQQAESTRVEFGVPMVSFCDLRISELNDHIDKYGKYGIGLSKEWAIAKGLHPVFYFNDENSLIPKYNDALTSYTKLIEGTPEHAPYLNQRSFMRLRSFLKHYQGPLPRAGITEPNYLFADEREWRYVPNFEEESNYALSYVPSSELKDGWKAKWNKKLRALDRQFALHYDAQDVKYLIVADDREARELVQFIQYRKAPMFRLSEADAFVLMSRILTVEQIREDI